MHLTIAARRLPNVGSTVYFTANVWNVTFSGKGIRITTGRHNTLIHWSQVDGCFCPVRFHIDSLTGEPKAYIVLANRDEWQLIYNQFDGLNAIIDSRLKQL